MVAWRGTTESTLELSKPPFVIATAQTGPTGWQLAFPSQGRLYAYAGTPPTRLIWFQLIQVLRGDPAGKGWVWSTNQAGWRLEQKSTGATLEGFLYPTHQPASPVGMQSSASPSK